MKRSAFKSKPTHKGFRKPTLADLRKPEHGQGFGLKRAEKPLARQSKPLRAKRDPKLAAWSKKVRERDGNQCQWPGGCQTGDARIDPHHKAKRSQRRDLKYELSNGLCLCRTHHEWTDDNHDEAVEMGLLNTQSRELARKELAA